MRIPDSLICLAAVLAPVLSACGDPLRVEVPEEQVLEYDFNTDDFAAWSFGLSDVQPDQEENVEFQASQRPLPAPFSVQGFYQAGTNVSDDLFMYYARPVGGLEPGKIYRLRFQLDFATNYHSGCTVGTGVSVWVKAGASVVEPQRVLANDGSWRMNIDKGEQSVGGNQAQVLSDIRNGVLGCPNNPRYEVRTVGPVGGGIFVTPGPTGEVWVFFGTESGFETRHEIYFTRFLVGATKLSPDD